MATRQVFIGQDSFEGGEFSDVASYRIPDFGVLGLTDAFVQEDGAAIERGGTIYKSDAAFDTSLRWIFDGYFKPGQRTVFASSDNFAVLDSDDESPVNLGSDGMAVPKPSAFIPDSTGAGMLFIGGGYIYAGSRKTANYTTGTVDITNGDATVTGTGTAFLANVDAGMLFQHGDERIYIVASVTDDTHLELTEPYEGVTDTGEAYTLRPIYSITAADPYPDAEFYWTTANRLLWAEDNLIRASEPLKPHDLTATIGGQEIPTTHALPEGVDITGGATVGLISIAFTTHGAWTLEGLSFDIAGPDGANQHRVQRYSGELILWDGTGIASWENRLVVPCVDGIFVVDGIGPPERVSHPFDEQVMSYVRRGFKCGQAAVARGHYVLPVYSGSVTMRDQLVCRIMRPIRAGGQVVYPWGHFSRHATDLIAYALRVGTDTREPTLLAVSSASDARVVECPFFDPSTDSEDDANGDTDGRLDLITRDFPTGNNTKNDVRHVDIRTEEVGADDPALAVAWSDGGTSSGAAQFDIAHFDIDVFGQEGVVYNNITCTVKEEGNGIRLYHCRINKFRREMRIRMRAREATSSLKVRSVELGVLPSGTRRH